MTHDELVRVALAWLMNQARCAFAGIEQQSWGPEIPDAIGWDVDSSIVVECKATRADFLSDQKKPHRNGEHSLGRYRYYLVPQGLVTVDEVPDGWGLLEHRESGHKAGYYVKKMKDAPEHPRERHHYRAEVRYLVLMSVRFSNAIKTLGRFAWMERAALLPREEDG